MANRNFNKKLALALGTMLGGVGALNSMNVSTSAMEQDAYTKMKTTAIGLKCDFVRVWTKSGTPNKDFYGRYDLESKFTSFLGNGSEAGKYFADAAYTGDINTLKTMLRGEVRTLFNKENYFEAFKVLMMKDLILNNDY